MPEAQQKVEHRRHVSKLDQSEECVVEVDLDESDKESVMVPVGPINTDSSNSRLESNEKEEKDIE